MFGVECSIQGLRLFAPKTAIAEYLHNKSDIAYMSGTPLSLSGHISCSILIDELSRKRLLQNQLGKLQVLILILMKQQQKFSKFYLSKDFQIEELGYGCRHWDQFVQRIPLKVTQTILAKLIYR